MQMVTVTVLVRNFAEACRLLVPHLDRALVPWRDADQYDNWDRIAEALFCSLVLEPCAFRAVQEGAVPDLRIARYGFEPSAEHNAALAVGLTRGVRMISLSTIRTPFDHVLCHVRTWILLEEAQFIFVFEAADGQTRQLRAVDLDTG